MVGNIRRCRVDPGLQNPNTLYPISIHLVLKFDFIIAVTPLHCTTEYSVLSIPATTNSPPSSLSNMVARLGIRPAKLLRATPHVIPGESIMGTARPKPYH